MENFSIAIPVYNEEEIMERNVEKIVSFLRGKKYRYEIVICDNGSTDGTCEIGKKMESKYGDKVIFISIPDRGVGNAFRNIVKKSSYEKIISLDMDLSVDLVFIEKCMRELKSNSVVVGSKSFYQNRTLFRKIISKFYVNLTNSLLGLDVSDYSIGAKGYKKPDIEDYLSLIDDNSFYVIEILYMAKRDGKKISEIDVKCKDLRKSKFNLFNEIFYRFFKLMYLRINGIDE